MILHLGRVIPCLALVVDAEDGGENGQQRFGKMRMEEELAEDGLELRGFDDAPMICTMLKSRTATTSGRMVHLGGGVVLEVSRREERSVSSRSQPILSWCPGWH